MNHYERLGVPSGADPTAIRRAYLALARRHHPDLHAGDDAATQARSRRTMQDLNQAWAVLGDPQRRRVYDDQLRRGTADGAPAARAGTGPPPGPAWRPRADDTGWMDDFAAWRDEADALNDDDDDSAPRRSRATPNRFAVVPVAAFLVAVAAGCVGLVVQSRQLLAAALVLVAVSATLFVVLPMLAMTGRGGRRR